MKRLTHAVMLLLGLSMVIMASCTKDPDNGGNNGGGNNGNTYNGHEYVDLGLPSGTLWATCNVGATKPEGCGDCFAWGETTPKNSYEWDNYKYGNGHSDNWDYDKLTKYCCQAEHGYNGFTDNLTTLEAIDDAATANWGNGWRTPTELQVQELLRFTLQEISFQNNVQGLTLTGTNHNSIFFPISNIDDDAHYWTSTLKTSDNNRAVVFRIGTLHKDDIVGDITDGKRRCGLFVRPVHSN